MTLEHNSADLDRPSNVAVIGSDWRDAALVWANQVLAKHGCEESYEAKEIVSIYGGFEDEVLDLIYPGYHEGLFARPVSELPDPNIEMLAEAILYALTASERTSCPEDAVERFIAVLADRD